ncbi:MAG: PD-(D/E)XK nuclease family protein, partial [Aeoliella sp.]
SRPELATIGTARLNGIQGVAERGARAGFGPYEGVIQGELVQAALAQRFNAGHLWSPSQLESYATCPFRFFSEHLLKLEPLSELALRGDARRRGSLLHQVLATIHQQLSRAAAPLEAHFADVELVEHFLAALDATVRRAPLRGIEQSLREIERREIESWAPKYAEQESIYRQQWEHLDQSPTPAYFEVRFGPDIRTRGDDLADPASTAVPFELDLGDEQIRLTGQIDRVDIGRVGQVTVFNIIDYKSGKREVKLNLDKVRSGHQLQLPLYALATEQLLLADQKAVALATSYWNIQGRGFGKAKGGSLHLRELTEQTLRISKDWQDLQPDLLRRVQELISGIRGGQFPVYNEDDQCTRSCSLSTVCHVAQVRSLEKIWPPPEDQGEQREEHRAGSGDGE